VQVGNSVFRLPVTEVQFINKSSLFVPLLNGVRHAETEAGNSIQLMFIPSAPLAQNRML